MSRLAFRGPLPLTLFVLVLLFAWDASGLDLVLAQAMGTPLGFPWRHDAFLARVMHEGAKNLSWLLTIGLFAAIFRPVGFFRRLTKSERIQLAVSALASVLVISLLKHASTTSCPWDLQAFGGTAHYVSHWSWGVVDGGGGHCFPAGHASAGFAYLGGYFALRRSSPSIARAWLACALVAGFVLGLSQQLRGAHFMSHTLWTAWLCWVTGYAIDACVQWLARHRAAANSSANLSGEDSITPSPPWRAFNDWVAQPRSARGVILWLSLYLAVAANWPLWSELARIGGAPSVYLPSIALMALLLLCGTVALLTFTAWSRWMKPLWFGVVVLAAVVQHYMLTYRVVMDPTMLANALQTDPNEVNDLMSWRLVFNVLWVSVLPAWALWRVRIVPEALISQAWRNAVLLLLAAVVAIGGGFAMNRQLAPLMRNNVHLRYMMNPLASIYSTAVAAVRPMIVHSRKLVPVTAGTALGASYADQERPPLFVLVVGETARADHFGLNGYVRNTTPELAARHVLSYRGVHSCGTNTLASVPCMFSPLGKDLFEARQDDYENLMDVLQASGLAVFWLDNQAGGCKGVCDRIPHASAFLHVEASAKSALCDTDDECLDDVMLQGLDERIAALPAERRNKGIVLVMHQMGSHGPAYYKRSSAEVKRFLPECKTNALAECSHSELINGYDNSIAYTDRFLGKTIDWLQGQGRHFDTALLYLSDHGESLGEYGLFLHGVPYGFAPEVQKHVPMVAWIGDGMQARSKLSLGCMKGGLDAPLSHDNLYHTVLGLMDVNTPTYKPALDAFAPCRGANVASAQ